MQELTLNDLTLRLGLALLIGLVMGFEREQHGRAAGMRTTMLVCVASAVVMMLSQYLFLVSSQAGVSWRPDPARLAAGVLAGMGFLGAGVIMKEGNSIYGVTTGAVLWFSAILGMAFGAGFIVLGLAGFAVVLLALFILPRVERRIRTDRYAHLEVSTTLRGPDAQAIQDAVQAKHLLAELKPAETELDLERKRRVINFTVKTRNNRLAEVRAEAVERAAKLKGVLKVRWY